MYKKSPYKVFWLGDIIRTPFPIAQWSRAGLSRYSCDYSRRIALLSFFTETFDIYNLILACLMQTVSKFSLILYTKEKDRFGSGTWPFVWEPSGSGCRMDGLHPASSF